MNLLLIDASAAAHRYYHAMPPMYSPRAKLQTHVVFGWLNLLLDQYSRIPGVPKDSQPIVFFDGGRASGAALLEGYKDNRVEKPEFLECQLQLIKVVTNLLGVASVYHEGVEADATLGSFVLNKLADPEDQTNIYILSSDKDMLQLVDGKRVFQIRNRHNGQYKLYGPDEVFADYGVKPSQIPDYLCLMGDDSDNIPNIPGVGKVTAKNLLTEYGSLDAILENLDKLKPKMRASFEACLDNLPNIRKLVTFSKDVPFELKTPKPKPEKLLEFCRELEFAKPIPAIMKKFDLF